MSRTKRELRADARARVEAARADRCASVMVALTGMGPEEYMKAGKDAVIDRIAELLEDDPPELPEGIEWPRFEDGELVRIGDRAKGEGCPAGRVRGIEIEYRHAIDMMAYTLVSSHGSYITSDIQGIPAKRAESDTWDIWYDDLAEYMYDFRDGRVADYLSVLDRFCERAKRLGGAE